MKSNTSLSKSASELPTTAVQWANVIAKSSDIPRTATAKENAVRANAVVIRSGGFAAVRDALAKKRQGQRGPQRSPTKLPVTVRYNPEVIAYFKSTGQGWQTRMNDALSEWVALREVS